MRLSQRGVGVGERSVGTAGLAIDGEAEESVEKRGHESTRLLSPKVRRLLPPSLNASETFTSPHPRRLRILHHSRKRPPHSNSNTGSCSLGVKVSTSGLSGKMNLGPIFSPSSRSMSLRKCELAACRQSLWSSVCSPWPISSVSNSGQRLLSRQTRRARTRLSARLR